MLQSILPSSGTWQVHSFTRGKKITRVEFRFSPAYVRAAMTRAPSRAATRGLYISPNQETLLLDNVLLLDGASGHARAWLVPSSTSEYYHLRVEVFVPPSVTRNVRVRLTWGKHTYTALVRAGQVFFEDITPPHISRLNDNLPSHRLRLSFELGENGKNGKR